MTRRRWGQPQRANAASSLTCPSYDDLRTQSALLAYVIGEGRHEQTIFELARRFSPDEGDAVERAVRDLVGGGMLSMEGGKVIPRLTSLAGHHVE